MVETFPWVGGWGREPYVGGFSEGGGGDTGIGKDKNSQLQSSVIFTHFELTFLLASVSLSARQKPVSPSSEHNVCPQRFLEH
jgi:hypothetical protein